MSILWTILGVLGLVACCAILEASKWMFSVRCQVTALRVLCVGWLLAPAAIALLVGPVLELAIWDTPSRYLVLLVFACPLIPVSAAMLYESFFPVLVLSSYRNRNFRRSVGDSLREVFGSCQVLTLETDLSLNATADNLPTQAGTIQHIPHVIFLRTPWWGCWEHSIEWIMRHSKVIVIDASLRSPSLDREMQIVESDQRLKERAILIIKYGTTSKSIAEAVRRELHLACQVRRSRPLWWAYLVWVLLHLGVVAAS